MKLFTLISNWVGRDLSYIMTAEIPGLPRFHPMDRSLHHQWARPCLPHQFRTRMNPIELQRTRSKSNKIAAKSTKLIDSLTLITVWLQVRVPPYAQKEAAN
jgi:hypothetical protein